jgi:nucleotide-binding universal stress UspA family protein
MAVRSDKIHRAILAEMVKYDKLLEAVDEDSFQRTPAENVWSYAEVFSHVLQANLGSLYAIDKCLLQTATLSPGRSNLVSWLILSTGRFPPIVKLKVPARIASQIKKTGKDEARQLMDKFQSRLEEIHARIDSADPDYKFEHPRLGLLNAIEWYRFVEIHTRHHEKQLQRIKSMLR